MEAYESAAEKRSGAGARIQTLYLISGLVLPVWQEVKRVLAAQSRPVDRRLHVIRLETTGGALSFFVLHIACSPLLPMVSSLCTIHIQAQKGFGGRRMQESS